MCLSPNDVWSIWDILCTTLLAVARCWLSSSCLSCVVMLFQVTDSWRAFLLLCLFLQLVSWSLVIYWSRCQWHNHPINRALQAHVQPPHCWGSVATSINTEFRRIDKFATGAPGARVIVTDSWVLKVSKESWCHGTLLIREPYGSPPHNSAYMWKADQCKNLPS